MLSHEVWKFEEFLGGLPDEQMVAVASSLREKTQEEEGALGGGDHHPCEPLHSLSLFFSWIFFGVTAFYPTHHFPSPLFLFILASI